jgi:hypothetical protein
MVDIEIVWLIFIPLDMQEDRSSVDAILETIPEAIFGESSSMQDVARRLLAAQSEGYGNDVPVARDFALDSGSASAGYITGCDQCENTWLPAENDMTGKLWVSCLRCRPGVYETTWF